MSNERAATAADIALGRKLRFFRRGRAMTQEKLAASIGVTFQQIQKYEKGANRIAVSRLLEIAAALEMDPADFLPITTARSVVPAEEHA